MSALPDMPDPHRRGILRWLWRGYVRAHGGTLVLALLFMMLEGAMLGALSWLIQPMFDEIFSAGRAEAIPLVGLAIAGVFAVRAVSAFAHTVLTARIGQRVSAKLQTNMLGHMLRLDSAWFQRHPPGLLIERMRGDTTTVSNLWEVVLAGFARDLVSVLALLGVALSIDWRWTLLVVAAAPVLVLPIGLLQRGVRVTSRGARERRRASPPGWTRRSTASTRSSCRAPRTAKRRASGPRSTASSAPTCAPSPGRPGSSR